MPPQVSLLPFVLAADNFPNSSEPYPTHHPVTKEPYVPFHVSRADYEAALVPVGLIRPEVLRAIADIENGPACPFELVRPDSKDVVCVAFAPDVLKGGREAMNKAIADIAARWRSDGLFSACLDGMFCRRTDLFCFVVGSHTQRTFWGRRFSRLYVLTAGWRNELYAIYASPRSSAFATASASNNARAPMGNAAFACERAACAVFGFATFGVHMTGEFIVGKSWADLEAYEGDGADMKIWVPRRSPTKATWPGMLDNVCDGEGVRDRGGALVDRIWR